jgi:uncharacterized protein
MKLRFFTSLLCILWVVALYGQDTSRVPELMKFYHINGKISSEGPVRDNKPDGYWKTYDDSGQLRSEGNRVDFMLDGLWKFYNGEGIIVLEINYKNDKKNGIRRAVEEEFIVEETFKDDLKHGTTTFFFPDGKIQRTLTYQEGLEHGISKEYDKQGRLITILEYRRGFIVNQEYINRFDNLGRKTGLWKDFWDNDIVKSEITYRADLRNGYYKEYDREGKLLKVEKYVNDELIRDAREVALYEIRYDYYPDGSVKVMGSYRDSVAMGIRKEFNPDGSISKSYILYDGYVVGEGLLDARNKRQGPWKEFYESGKLLAEGSYKDDIRIGEWKFYFSNGQLEQTGTYLADGKADGLWKWYYSDGKLRREETYAQGIETGRMTEYDESGGVMVSGSYTHGLREGLWKLKVNEYNEEGEYMNDVKEGFWKSYFSNGIPHSEGNYVDGLPDGIHKLYWENGILYQEGTYVMGVKEGDWRFYNREGELYLIIKYKNGIEKSYNSVLIEPELPDDNL